MAEEKPKVRRFPEGDVLDAIEGGKIVRASPTSVVVVAGPVQCGKTTLVGGLYELFHRGPFDGYHFANSRTLPGFERRCHKARISSGLETPETDRTIWSEGKDLLHLKLANEDGLFHGILFSDIYGEAFQRAADVTEECLKFTVLKRADHVAILVDGAKAANKTERQAAFSSADALLRQCLDSGMFDDESSVQVIVTKWDLVAGKLADEGFIDTKLAKLKDSYATRLGILTTHKVSIRPTSRGLTPGHGMADLLRRWTQIRWRYPATPSVSPGMFHTEFDRSTQTLSAGGPTSG